MKPLKKAQRDQLASGYCTAPRPNGHKPKRGYPTKAAAKRAAKRIDANRARQQGSNERLYAYECDRCGEWHVSHSPPRRPGGRRPQR